MNGASYKQRVRRTATLTATRTVVAALLVAALLLAETLTLGHPYDSPSHSNDQLCAVCVAAAAFHAGNAAAPPHFDFAATAPVVAVAISVVFFSAVPTRRYARGPPAGSFAL